MEIIVEYVINNDRKLRKVKTNENNFSEIRKKLREYHNTDDVKIKFISKNYDIEE